MLGVDRVDKLAGLGIRQFSLNLSPKPQPPNLKPETLDRCWWDSGGFLVACDGAL